MTPLILACGSCAGGVQAVLFPPVGFWALIACLWFVSAVVVRKRYEIPSRLVPGPLGAIAAVVILTALAAGGGPAVYLLLIPPTIVSAGHKIVDPESARSDVGRRRVVALFAAAVVCLSVTAGVAYWRVSRMTPTQRVLRVANSYGADLEIARLARAQADPLEDYREILATTDSPRVAEAIGRHLDCRARDTDCASVLIELLQRVRSDCDADALQKELRETTGLELPPNATPQNWRERLAQIDNRSSITRTLD